MSKNRLFFVALLFQYLYIPNGDKEPNNHIKCNNYNAHKQSHKGIIPNF